MGNQKKQTLSLLLLRRVNTPAHRKVGTNVVGCVRQRGRTLSYLYKKEAIPFIDWPTVEGKNF